MNREELLASDDLATDTFDCPKWGQVTIRELNGEQREELENLIQGYRSKAGVKKTVRAMAAVYSMLDSSGNLLFKPTDVDLVAKKSGVALDTVFAHVLTLNALTKEEAAVISGN